MTDDKDFKQLVRAEARRTGRRYTTVREELRPTKPAEPLEADAVRRAFDAIVACIETWRYGKPEVARVVATALLVPGNVLVRGMPGNGMTALGHGVAAAVGGHLVSVDGRTGLDPSDLAAWRPDDVVVVAHLDGLDRGSQVAVVEAATVPAIVLAKVHPISRRMPFPPDDETRERFLLGVVLGPADAETELRILDEVRDHTSIGGSASEADITQLAGMRAAAAAVEVPTDVRRHVVEMTAAIRADPAVLVGPSTIATLALVRTAGAVAVAAGRRQASVDDVRAISEPVLGHRLVLREGADADIATVIDRAAAARP